MLPKSALNLTTAPYRLQIPDCSVPSSSPTHSSHDQFEGIDPISTVSTDSISVFYPKSHISLQISAVLSRLGVLYNAFVDVLFSTDLLDFGVRESGVR